MRHLVEARGAGVAVAAGSEAVRDTQRLVAALLSIVLLLTPALWNGFPLLEYDTGGYLAR